MSAQDKQADSAGKRRPYMMNRRSFLLYSSTAVASTGAIGVGLPGVSFAATGRTAGLIDQPGKAALAGLADTLYGSAADNSRITAGYTYFGQFVAHDVSFTTVSGAGRTPGLDLDSLYGARHLPAPWYEHNNGRLALVRHELDSQLPQKVFLDVPRQDGRAVMADERNDDNVILSQLHVLWAQFHNMAYDRLKRQGATDAYAYARARRTVTACYQRIVRQDFLKTLCSESTYREALRREARGEIGRHVAISMEAAAAGFRLHPMVRSVYQINMGTHPTELTELLLRGGDRDVAQRPAKFVVDWRRLFAVPGEAGVIMPARQFTPQFVPTFRTMPTPDGAIDMARSLFERDGSHQLPSGQALAESYAIARLTPAEMIAGAPAAQRDVLRRYPELTRATPLWYYLMLESLVKEDGQRLGPTASRLLCDAFLALPRVSDGPAEHPWTGITTMGELIASLQSAGAGLWTRHA